MSAEPGINRRVLLAAGGLTLLAGCSTAARTAAHAVIPSAGTRPATPSAGAPMGLTESEADRRRKSYGENTIADVGAHPLWRSNQAWVCRIASAPLCTTFCTIGTARDQ